MLLTSRNEFLTLVTSGDLRLKRSHSLVNLGRISKGIPTQTAFCLARTRVTQVSWQCWAIHYYSMIVYFSLTPCKVHVEVKNCRQNPLAGPLAQRSARRWLSCLAEAQGVTEKEAKASGKLLRACRRCAWGGAGRCLLLTVCLQLLATAR